MKKTIITMLITLVAMIASAETYNYLKFTKTNGTTVTYSVEGLKLTYDNTNVYVTNDETTATIALAEVQDMYFSNDGSTTPSYKIGDVNMDGNVNIDDVTALIDYLLSGNASNIDVNAADVDQSGNVSIDDVTGLIDMLLSGNV
ncbi:MAG: dockerin type I repeat-containing protein [Muribaculaceae bacterium]|nr:dockerin type I repeat-containing protein [Muribaculaceae bacterium]